VGALQIQKSTAFRKQFYNQFLLSYRIKPLFLETVALGIYSQLVLKNFEGRQLNMLRLTLLTAFQILSQFYPFSEPTFLRSIPSLFVCRPSDGVPRTAVNIPPSPPPCANVSQSHNNATSGISLA
jgi:hypothetical protein